MRSTIKSQVLLLWVTMSLCASALAGCTILTGPTSRNDTLSAVSCLSANTCVAVGSEATITGQAADETLAPVAMRWDGSRWHALAVRLPSGAVHGTLSSVSCKPGGCLAVGNYYPPAGIFALAEYWNDSTWAPVTLAFPPGPQYPFLRAVSCVTVGQCVATGDSEKLGSSASPLAATWDGHEWSWSQPPVRADVEGNGFLSSVSCVTARYCVAIGHADDYRSGSTVGVTELWNGHGWTQAYASAPEGTGEAASLSCAAAGYCVAVGTQFASVPAGFGQLLDGTHWAEPAMPWPPATRSYLYGVSCAGKTCLAVGEAEASGVPIGTASQPAALTWNGATWTRSPAQATPSGTTGTLSGVTCVTAADCVAVGSTRVGNGTRDLSEFWNGTAWTILTSSPP